METLLCRRVMFQRVVAVFSEQMFVSAVGPKKKYYSQQRYSEKVLPSWGGAVLLQRTCQYSNCRGGIGLAGASGPVRIILTSELVLVS